MNTAGDHRPVNFMEGEFFALSPFSLDPVTIWGETFATVEHAYQCARILPGPERDAIKSAPTPLGAWREGQKYKHNPALAVAGFEKYAVMEELFRAKLAQHAGIAALLQSSGDRELQKVIATDAYWGTGADGLGENQMGKLWMRLREEID